MRKMTNNYTYTFFLIKRNDRHAKADYRIYLSIKRYERVIDYVLYEQQIEKEEGGREREKLIKYAIENKYLNQSIKRLYFRKKNTEFYPIGLNNIIMGLNRFLLIIMK